MDISFRIKPGIDAHTHDFVRTGQIDSKFGVALETGEAFEFVKAALSMKNVRLAGVHCHIGSQIFQLEPFELAAKVLVNFIREVKETLGYDLKEINLGGGFGIKHLPAHDPVPPEECVKAVAEAVKAATAEAGLAPLRLVLEPGRAIVGSAGITVYEVGCVKNIPGVRNYISVDGGMADNPRYILYGSEYEALLPARPEAERTTLYTIAGKCCESGDVLIKDIMLPEVQAGDYLAVLATGAYNYSMASNYNRLPRPPVVMVNGGKVKLAVRRETYDDLTGCDVMD
jgi:diaminopimelate decarboxylase